MLTLSAITRIVFLFLFGLLAVVIFSVAALTVSTHREYVNTKKRQIKLKIDHDRIQKRLEEKNIYLKKMQTDPVFLERIIREKLHYIRSDEMIFYFEPKRSGQKRNGSFSR